MNATSRDLGAGLYAAREKIHPREVNGRFQRFRIAAAIALLGVYYGLPWIQFDGHQAMLFDLPARKFHVFGLVFLPQDFYLLTWVLVIAALSLFFFTALAGRLWCGYACPQTVWTEAFLFMERLTEGKRAQRLKLDKSAWFGRSTASKWLRKSAKQVLWIAFSLWTGFTFVGYFTPARDLLANVASLSLGPWESFWVLFYGFATYGNAGFMREQVCKYMCPYARFQSAMFDRHTLVIGYDAARGDPRGARARGSNHRKEGMGDCVDCTLCVQVCPTGIDIRKGLQYECIACAACIDACDGVMDKMGYARGLIRYSTQEGIEGAKGRTLRPRTIIYGALLIALVIGFGYAVTHRTRVALDVLRDRNALYRELKGERIENVYTVRIVNKDTAAHEFSLHVTDLPGAELDSEMKRIVVAGGEVASTALRVRVPEHTVAGGRDIAILVTADDAPEIKTQTKARFFAPRED